MRVVPDEAVPISGNFSSLLGSECAGVRSEGSEGFPASVLGRVRVEVIGGEGVTCGGAVRA